MNERVEQARISRFAFDVFYTDQITFLSIMECSESGSSRMLMWKRGTGFEARLVLQDPSSDLERSKPLDEAEFPTNDVVRLVREHPEALSGDLAAQLVDILQRKNAT